MALVRQNLKDLEKMSDEDIDISDIPEVTDFTGWTTTDRFYRPVKDQVTLRIDRPVLEWFKFTEEKYQTAINAVLRSYVDERRAEMRRRIAEEDAPYDASSDR